ncbi:Mu transposase C-terminal domain-containing protein, partial [Yersinia enterocolitica]
RTRYVVGWSLSLAENVIAVADALRHGMQSHGIPLIYYSDNGAGQTANVLDADITGILSRLGVEHPTGIPGNPQARGIIERLNREIPA